MLMQILSFCIGRKFTIFHSLPLFIEDFPSCVPSSEVLLHIELVALFWPGDTVDRVREIVNNKIQ